MKKMIVITQNENKINFNDKIEKLYLLDLENEIIYKGNLTISSYKEHFSKKNLYKHHHFDISENNFNKLLLLNFNKDVKNKKFIDFIKKNQIEECIV